MNEVMNGLIDPGQHNAGTLQPLLILPHLANLAWVCWEADIPSPILGQGGNPLFPKDPHCRCSSLIMNNRHSAPRIKPSPWNQHKTQRKGN